MSIPRSLSRQVVGLAVVCLVLVVPVSWAAETWVFTHFAGSTGGGGPYDGVGAAARFGYPNGIAADVAGNVYVVDTLQHTIRRVTPAGVVTTVAGRAGVSGNADGAGSDARFNWPTGVVVDAAGNLYVADSSNNTIRKITPAGVVTTFAGDPSYPGSDDGTGSAAHFLGPAGIAADSAGNLYVSDQYNQTIRKITPAGVVTTLAGLAGSTGAADGTGAAARFYYPLGIAVGSGGNVYVADQYNQTIRKITSAGVVTTLAGQAGVSGSADGNGTAARFLYPTGVATDSAGNVYVADNSNSSIRKISPLGDVTTVAGAAYPGFSDGTGTAASFAYPQNLAIDSAGNIWVTDTENRSIRKIAAGGVVTTVAGAPAIRGILDGTGAAARFYNPTGVATDAAGNVYVADEYNESIRKITPAGVVTTFAGQPGNFGSAEGPRLSATFSYPVAVAADAGGNIYVADTYNRTIRKIAAAGTVSTFAGQTNVTGSSDGIGSLASFSWPMGVATDAAGNVYVGDQNNHTIRKITPGGAVTTLAGQAGVSGSSDGIGSAARFSYPAGVAVDAAGNVYVADQYNCTIRKITPAAAAQRQPRISWSTSLQTRPRHSALMPTPSLLRARPSPSPPPFRHRTTAAFPA